MAQEHVTKKLHYHHARFLNGNQNLQALLKTALNARPRAKHRREAIDVTGKNHRLVNDHVSQLGMLFGNLMVYEEGTNHALVTMDDDARALQVEQIAPPPAGGKRREFLDSILYFGVLGNHLMVMQSTSLKARQLEVYLNWLLRESGALDNENGVSLDIQPLPAAREKILKAPVKKLRIGTPLAVPGEVAEGAALGRANQLPAKKVRFAAGGKALDVLAAFLGQDEFAKLNFDAAMESNLELALEVTYRRQTTDTGQRLLNNIATAFRHVDEEDLTVELKGGGRVQGRDLKLIAPISVVMNNGLVDQNDLYPRIHKCLQDYINQGLIEP